MSQSPPRTPPSKPPPLPDFADSKPSSFARKMRLAPSSWGYGLPLAPPQIDLTGARKGWLFVYGSLCDPTMLVDVLELPEEPVLRPAYICGYWSRMWGQYPAVLYGPAGMIVEGAAFEVQSIGHAEKLAIYETSNYKADPCLIKFTDNEEPSVIHGSVFIFVGNIRDLSAGAFDLTRWLRSVGRHKAAEKLEAKKKIRPSIT
ncbi:putative poly(A) polymerase pla1 [Myriangium duriaei CBS 260.36]|uniref:Putative gamma-glutamylcyclotransferase n=1 Tax=Myriangium duriaei CBS 260.36 TaxID=1168546 RepID=A0A9P4MJQ0_9PEZI|nr:putative poly(A) polymerase pla1 [Myriangium duriaei CBS 260.36]